MDDRRELETIAIFVHGALALGHAIGIFYNLRRRNYKVVMVFDLAAVVYHIKDRKNG